MSRTPRTSLALINWLMARMRRLARKGFSVILDLIPPKKGLVMLLSLDNAIYKIEGILATSYGGGVHTKHRHTNYHEFFSHRIRANERVLDLGCGNGVLTLDIARTSGAKIMGVDLKEEKILMAKELNSHPNIEYRVGDATREPFNEPFDVVILSNLLEHLSFRKEFLRDICRSVKPKRILIRVPLFERDWRVPLKRELGLEWRLDPTHEVEYTIESFCKEMAEAGLQIIHQEVRWGEIWSELRIPQDDAAPEALSTYISNSSPAEQINT